MHTAAKVMNVFGISALVVTLATLLFFMQHVVHPVAPAEVTIGDTTIRVEVADTSAKRVQGLSGRTGLAEGEGMLFVFEEEGSWSMWMKDMRFAIDIIWVTKDGTIITIAKNVSPETYPQTFFASEPTARYVLEVPAGFVDRHSIAEGQKIVVQ